MIIRHTGSQMDRVARCEASAALPQVIDANEQRDRDRGIGVHDFLDRLAKTKDRDAALAEVDPKWRDVCGDIDIAKLADRLSLSTEVALAYNWKTDTARLLQVIEHRAYDVDVTCEVPATLDVVGVQGSTVFIGDYKGPWGWLPDPERSYQLGLGAVAVARMYKATRANVEYIRIRDDGTPRTFRGELDVFALEEIASDIQRIMGGAAELRARVEAGLVPDVVRGPWCRHCPARLNCPANTSMVRAAMTDVPQVASYALPVTPENAAHVYKRWREAREALGLVESALFAYGKTTPVPLGADEDGSLRFFGELSREGNDVLDGTKAHQVLAKRFGGEAANAAVTMEVTKKAITDVARKHLQPGEKITKVVESIIDEIDKAGGITNPTTTTTVEYTVSPDGEAKDRKRKAS